MIQLRNRAKVILKRQRSQIMPERREDRSAAYRYERVPISIPESLYVTKTSQYKLAIGVNPSKILHVGLLETNT